MDGLAVGVLHSSLSHGMGGACDRVVPNGPLGASTDPVLHTAGVGMLGHLVPNRLQRFSTLFREYVIAAEVGRW